MSGRALYNAAMCGAGPELRAMLEKGADVNWKNPNTVSIFDH